MATPQPKILIGTSLAASKLYAVPFLLQTVRALGASNIVIALDGILPPDGMALNPNEEWLPLTPDASLTWPSARCSRVREATRAYFLDHQATEGWTHLYWHDADMLPPANVLSQLAALEKPVASALYNLRGAGASVSIPGSTPFPTAKPEAFRPLPMGALVGLPDLGEGLYESAHFGMGCMLVEAAVLQKTGFGDPTFLETAKLYEDVYWCLLSRQSVVVDTDLSSWHVDADGNASRIDIGPSAFQVMWHESTPVTTRLGAFNPGEVRTDVAEETAADLGPGFIKGNYPQLTVEIKPVTELLPMAPTVTVSEPAPAPAA